MLLLFFSGAGLSGIGSSSSEGRARFLPLDLLEAGLGDSTSLARSSSAGSDCLAFDARDEVLPLIGDVSITRSALAGAPLTGEVIFVSGASVECFAGETEFVVLRDCGGGSTSTTTSVCFFLLAFLFGLGLGLGFAFGGSSPCHSSSSSSAAFRLRPRAFGLGLGGGTFSPSQSDSSSDCTAFLLRPLGFGTFFFGAGGRVGEDGSSSDAEEGTGADEELAKKGGGGGGTGSCSGSLLGGRAGDTGRLRLRGGGGRGDERGDTSGTGPLGAARVGDLLARSPLEIDGWGGSEGGSWASGGRSDSDVATGNDISVESGISVSCITLDFLAGDLLAAALVLPLRLGGIKDNSSSESELSSMMSAGAIAGSFDFDFEERERSFARSAMSSI